MGLGVFLVLSAPLFADASDDCIAEFEDIKSQFVAANGSADYDLNCVQEDNMISVFTEGPLPAGCSGNWDHWHLEARGLLGNEASCKLQLRDLEGATGCGTDVVEIDLTGNQAAAWRNYLRDECP